LGWQVPLPDGALDVAVYCLSLMGTNYLDFVREGVRTLKAGYACA
jgi:ribosomal RNA-processing protein 8